MKPTESKNLKATGRRLVLRRESLRELTVADLRQIAGGLASRACTSGSSSRTGM